MKLALLTFHRASNCGAMLQAWALKRVLLGLGHTVILPNSNSAGIRKRWRVRVSLKNRGFAEILKDLLLWPLYELFALGVEDLRQIRYKRFSRRYLKPVAAVTSAQLASSCDAAVIGSDQVWNPICIQREKDVRWFFGEDFPDGFVRFSYASSIGDRKLSELNQRRLKAATSKYARLLVRESYAGNGLSDKFGRPASEVLDPSLLLKPEDYQEIAYPKRLVAQRYLVVYIVAQDISGLYEFVEDVAKMLGLKVVYLQAYSYGRFLVPRNSVVAFSPDRFLAYIRDAECVIACSFHGIAFATIYRKPFLAMLSESATKQSRVTSLLRKLQMTNRIVTPQLSKQRAVELLNAPIEETVYKILDQQGVFSRRELINALHSA